jgi:hypothetical protein
MGAAMGQRLLDEGFSLVAWDRTPDNAVPLAERGAEVCDNAIDAVRDADIVITMLATADAVTAVMLHSTSSPRQPDGSPRPLPLTSQTAGVSWSLPVVEGSTSAPRSTAWTAIVAEASTFAIDPRRVEHDTTLLASQKA